MQTNIRHDEQSRRDEQGAEQICNHFVLPPYRNKFERISKRRGKKRAIIAIARMILIAVFHMLRNGEYFNPCDLRNVDTPDSIKKSRLLHSAKSAADFLVALGVVSSDSICLSALAV